MSEALIQTAIYDRLRASPELLSLLAFGEDSILDYKPQDLKPEDDKPFPFVTFGDDQHEQWDTDTTIGSDSDLQIHVWSRHKGRLEAKQIQAKIKAALHYHDLQIEEGAEAILLQWISSSVTPDPDGKTHHGIQTFNLLMDEATS